MRKLLLSLAVLSVIAVPVAGCGGDEGSAASGAAELVPAGALVYGEATLEPEGDQKEAIDNILAKFPGGGEAGDKLKDLVEKAFREGDVNVNFKEDVEPWLGDKAAFFASGPAQAGQLKTAAALVATDDEEAALEALEKVDGGKVTKREYNGVEYLDEKGDGAGATIDGYLVLGTEAGVKAAIDASKDGAALSDDDAYKKATEDAAEDRLGLLFVNTPEFVKTMGQGTISALPDSFKKFFKEPVVATVDADDDGVLIESTVPEEIAKTLAFFGQGSELLTDMPADSWLALGQTDFGKLLDFYVDAFAGAAGGRDQIEGQFKAATGLDLQKDVIAWMGDFGIFVRGTSVSDLDGALVVQTSDEAASGRFIAALERLAKSQAEGVQIGPLSAPGGGEGFTGRGGGIPKPIHVFQRGGRVVFAYGDSAASEAVDASQKLADSPDFTAARDSLGDYDVSFYLLAKPILDLVDSTEAANDADWQEAKPYLEPLSALVGGTSGDGDDLKSAFKIVVK